MLDEFYQYVTENLDKLYKTQFNKIKEISK